jgi:hypothetical protein
MNAEEYRDLKNKVDSIYDLLVGDDFGRTGMVTNQRNNHERISKIEEAHKRIVWLGGIGTFLLGLLIAFKEEIKAFFTHGHH